MNELKPAQKNEIIREIYEIMDGYNEKDGISSRIESFMKNKSTEKLIFKNEINVIIENSSGKKIGGLPDLKDYIGWKNYKNLIGIVNKKDNNLADELYMHIINTKEKQGGLRADDPDDKIEIKPGAEYTYLISGTNNICKRYTPFMNKKLETLSENYFLPEDGSGFLCSRKSACAFAKYLNASGDNFSFKIWYGENDIRSRDKISDKIAGEIAGIINKNENAAFNLIGHSHGGNVMVRVINKLIDGYKIRGIENHIYNLLTISTPIRNPSTEPEYHLSPELEGKINHINLYNPYDFVQQIGWIDYNRIGAVIMLLILSAFFSLINLLCEPGHHHFKNAKKVTFLWKEPSPEYDELYQKIRKLVKKDKGTPAVKRHQITRSVDFVKRILDAHK